ncbi:hypothetical protein ACQUY5_16590 [Bacillus cereus]|uniref:hypothetical protein n=1 Tax=Bacillus cereus TaxID=1396 RepID=UPI003D16C77D
MLTIGLVSKDGATSKFGFIEDDKNIKYVDTTDEQVIKDWCQTIGVTIPDNPTVIDTGVLKIKTYKVDKEIEYKQFSTYGELPSGLDVSYGLVNRDVVLFHIHKEDKKTTVYTPIPGTVVYKHIEDLTEVEKPRLNGFILHLPVYCGNGGLMMN